MTNYKVYRNASHQPIYKKKETIKQVTITSNKAISRHYKGEILTSQMWSFAKNTTFNHYLFSQKVMS